MAMTPRTRWLALYVLCLASLMIVLDTTIVNVALPSIQEDLGFSRTSLAWVVNAYMLTFGGFLLLVMCFGIRPPLGVGLGLAAVGLLLLARAPVDGSFTPDVLPSMILLGFGAGMAFNPLLLAAMSDVAPEESGLASGVVNTAFMMGGALGLAILASLAASHTDALASAGSVRLEALTGGYHVAFVIGAAFAASAAVIGAVLLRDRAPAASHAPAPAARPATECA